MVQNTVQSSYGRYMTAGAAGQPADMHNYDADTRICESTAIGFGLAVSKTGNDNGCILGGTVFAGIAVRDVTISHDTPDQYQEGDNVAVMVRGDIWVKVGAAVEAGRAVSYNTTTGVIGTSGTAIAGAAFLDSAAENGFARVRLSNAIGDLTT